MDSITFPKLIPSATHATAVLVYQKGQLGDYGTDSIRQDYFSFADEINTADDGEKVLFAQVILNGASNLNILRAMGGDETYKHPMLFIYPKGSNIAVQYPTTSPFVSDSLKRFLAKHTDINIRIPGTNKVYDDFVKRFFKASGVESAAAIIQEAESGLTAISDAADKESAEYYVKVLKKVHSIGPAHLVSEISRLKVILKESKISAKTKRNIESHINILLFFQSEQRQDTVHATPASIKEL